MPRCCNCGCDITVTDRTGLCDSCKKIILPFIKFTDASTSSALRRLLSNEKNLRKMGVTDSGMEYLLRICELHDRRRSEERRRIEERREREAARETVEAEAKVTPSAQELREAYSELELPPDSPLDLHRRPYGRLFPIASVALIPLGALSVILELTIGEKSISTILCSVGLMALGYALFDARHLFHDLEEIKRWFR